VTDVPGQQPARGLTRAEFVLGGALSVAAASGAAAVGPFVSDALAQAGGSDRALVEFALLLERLEAAFFARAMTETSTLGNDLKPLLASIANDEQQHVKYLSSIDQQYAGVPGSSPSFDFCDAFSSRSRFLQVATLIEDAVVASYNGGAPQLQSKGLLQSIGEIVQVEGRHAAAMRALGGQPIAASAFDFGSTEPVVTARLSPYLPKVASIR
jgi:Ferritin-like domain